MSEKMSLHRREDLERENKIKMAIENRVEAEVKRRVEVIIGSEVVQKQIAAKLDEERAKMQKEVRC